MKLSITCPSGTTMATIITTPLRGKHVIISAVCNPIVSSPSSIPSTSVTTPSTSTSTFDFYSPVS